MVAKSLTEQRQDWMDELNHLRDALAEENLKTLPNCIAKLRISSRIEACNKAILEIEGLIDSQKHQ